MDQIIEILPALFLVVVAGIVLPSLKWVRRGRVIAIERMGRYDRTLGAGLHFVMPLFERVVSDRAEGVETLTASVIATGRDGNSIAVACDLSYEIVDHAKAASDVPDVEQALTRALEARLRSIVAEARAGEVRVRDPALGRRIAAAVAPAATSFGARVAGASIQSVRYAGGRSGR